MNARANPLFMIHAVFAHFTNQNVTQLMYHLYLDLFVRLTS